MMTGEDFQRLAEWLRAYPQLESAGLWVLHGTITSLEFLRFFPHVRRFSADALYHSLQTLDGLRHSSEELEALGIGLTKHNLDLASLGRFKGLGTLFLEGQSTGIAVLGELTALEDSPVNHLTGPERAGARLQREWQPRP